MHACRSTLEDPTWPHDNSEIYDTFNRIFDCRGHGWSNLQSTHLNLPFASDEEFARLHAAIRLVLPLLPALAASSPIMERKRTGFDDMRLEVYRKNSALIPSITGQVIPEAVFSEEEYRSRIFEPMWADIAPHDPEGVLRDEFLNARGAIARFERGSIEIRVLDAQECPTADLAIVQTVVAVLEAMVNEKWTTLAEQQAIATETLVRFFLEAIRRSSRASIDDPQYLAQFGYQMHAVMAGEVWQFAAYDLDLYQNLPPKESAALDNILVHGPLATRLQRESTVSPSLSLEAEYALLCDCLAEGRTY